MKHFTNIEFGARLKKSRESKKMTQEQLAEALGLASKQHVSRMERGKSGCSIDLIAEIAQVLEISLDYLILGDKYPARATQRRESSFIIFYKVIRI